MGSVIERLTWLASARCRASAHASTLLRPLVVVAGAVVLSVAGCGTLTGLDQITESACAPYCGDTDGGVDPSADGPIGDHDAGVGPDASSERGTRDASAPEVLPPEAQPDEGGLDGEPEAALEAGAETGPESGTRGEAGTDAAAFDAGAEAGVDSGPCGIVYFRDGFSDASKGWTLDTTWSIASTCTAPPAPQKGNPDPTVDHTSGAAGGVIGAYACGNNVSGSTEPARYAVSPVIDVSEAPSVVLTFYRWLNSDAAGWMTSTVDVYDGSAWVNVYTNPTGSGNIVADAAWTQVQYDVSAHKNAHFQVRFGYALASSSVYSMSCWNVDDVTVSSAACP
jgi:hypothetical protein